MAFGRFVSHRGNPFELLSDCGTNFRAGEAEAQNALQAMKPDLSVKMALCWESKQQQEQSCTQFWLRSKAS